MRKLILILLFSFTFVFAQDSTKVNTRKPWEFWVSAKGGIYSNDNIVGPFNEFWYLPTFGIGVRFINNRQILGFNSTFDIQPGKYYRYKYLNFDIYYAISLIKRPKFRFSFGVGFLTGFLIDSFYKDKYGNEYKDIGGEDQWAGRFNCFLEANQNISKKVSLGLIFGFLTSPYYDHCSASDYHHPPVIFIPQTIDCGIGNTLRYNISLNYKFLQKWKK